MLPPVEIPSDYYVTYSCLNLMNCANVTKKESVMRACARDVSPKMLYKSSPCHRKVAARYIRYHQKTRLCDRYLSNKGNGTFRRVAAFQNVIQRHANIRIHMSRP